MRRIALVVGLILALGATTTALAAGGKTKGVLKGKYQTKISGTKAFGGILNGTWVLSVGSGHYSVSKNGKFQVAGKDQIKGHVIVLRDKKGPASCKGVTGKYRYSLSGRKLTFKKISDPGK